MGTSCILAGNLYAPGPGVISFVVLTFYLVPDPNLYSGAALEGLFFGL